MGGSMTGMLDILLGSFTRRLFNRPPSCKIAVKNEKAVFSGGGGDGVLQVTASGSCVWKAESTVDWIKVTSGTGVSGAGVVSYTVKPGIGKSRSGAISIVAASGGTGIKGRASLVVSQAEQCCAGGF